MLTPSSLFNLPFTCTDATGLPTSPTGSPTAILVKNGTDLGTTVTVTMSGAQGLASCIIPADAVAGDRFHLRVSAVISSITYVVSGPSDAITGPVSLIADYNPAKTAAPTALAIASLVRTELATELARLDATVSSRLASVNYTSPPSISDLATSDSISSLSTTIQSLPSASQIAAEILLTPENKLLTNAVGEVTSTNGGAEGTGGGGNYATFVMPLRATSPERVQANRIDLFVRERVPLTISIQDALKQPVNCQGLLCTLFIQGGIEIPDLIPTSDTSEEVPHRYTFTPPATLTAQPATLWFSLRVNDSTQQVLAFGHIVIAEVP